MCARARGGRRSRRDGRHGARHRSRPSRRPRSRSARRPDRGAHRGRTDAAGRDARTGVAPRHLRDAVLGGEPARARRRRARRSPRRPRARSRPAPRRHARIAAVIRSTHSRFRGCGSPWPITLVSSATTGSSAGAPRSADLVGDEQASRRRLRRPRVRRCAATSAPAWHAAASAAAASSPRASPASRTPSNASPAPVGSTSSIGLGRPPRRSSRRRTGGAPVPVLDGGHRDSALPAPAPRRRPVSPTSAFASSSLASTSVARRRLLEEPLGADGARRAATRPPRQPRSVPRPASSAATPTSWPAPAAGGSRRRGPRRLARSAQVAGRSARSPRGRRPSIGRPPRRPRASRRVGASRRTTPAHVDAARLERSDAAGRPTRSSPTAPTTPARAPAHAAHTAAFAEVPPGRTRDLAVHVAPVGERTRARVDVEHHVAEARAQSRSRGSRYRGARCGIGPRERHLPAELLPVARLRTEHHVRDDLEDREHQRRRPPPSPARRRAAPIASTRNGAIFVAIAPLAWNHARRGPGGPQVRRVVGLQPRARRRRAAEEVAR